MIVRVPIKRKAIKLPKEVVLQLKLQEMQQVTREDDILEIAQHYDMLARKTSNKGGYNSLSRNNPTAHKNWVHFEYVYEICRIKSWDPKLYLEAQFKRAEGWNFRRFPLPNMLYSEKALKYFTNYLSTVKQKYERDVGGREKEKGSETKSITQEVIDGIVSSVETLSRYIENTNQDKERYKMVKLFQSWQEYSVYYLWSVPWFHQILDDLPQDDKKVMDCRAQFDMISQSKSLQGTITTTVEQVENHFNIPKNISL